MATANEAISTVVEQVVVELRDGIKFITLNAPERLNAVDRPMAERFRDAVIESAEDDCKVVVITGAGGQFCSGADVNALRSPDGGFENAIDFLEEVSNPIILNLRKMAKPVIAAIPGVAAGIGCNFALAADIRIASTKARFGEVFSRIGLIPDGGGDVPFAENDRLRAGLGVNGDGRSLRSGEGSGVGIGECRGRARQA